MKRDETWQVPDAVQEELTAERLRALVAYDPETGVFTWRTNGYNNVVLAGDPVGGLDEMGYLRAGIKGVKYRLHRLAWLYVYGKWPDNDIDHINGNRTDNRLANLRDVPRQLNVQNGQKKVGAAGLRGVTPKGRRFLAQIQCNGRTVPLGRFDTAEEAHAAYVAAKRLYHPGFTGRA
jgi:hypothetical protein